MKRIAATLLTAVAASILLFLLFELSPRSVAIATLGPFATPEQQTLWLQAHGYMQPPQVRYCRWLGHFLIGDFGQSRAFAAPVSSVLWPRLGHSLILVACFFAITLPVALPLGIAAGLREGSAVDRIVSAIAVATSALPPFASAVLLSALLVTRLHLVPGTSIMTEGWDWRQVVLPVLVLVLSDVGYLARITRTSMAEIMATPYIRAAILKGMSPARILFRHALRNAMITPFTIIMLQVNWAIGGVVVVEAFYSFHGIGTLLLQAALRKDLPLLEAATFVLVMIAGITQMLADIGYAFLNPRIRLS
ncbi:ABC transporter permease [Gluconacetobacter tumulisoli]|uniref:ABC transporter permease n=1 Tax=Gluconacetobacter tumulisoli TaxID=1286189 RepID=A0A7W4PPH5_9PROT|nr:ABC transporter permease [Gluconacetobacter tumulisoli]MBB2201836.1 ABC transporter permease [Gluconacetobacter tumulisoli]